MGGWRQQWPFAGWLHVATSVFGGLPTTALGPQVQAPVASVAHATSVQVHPDSDLQQNGSV